MDLLDPKVIKSAKSNQINNFNINIYTPNVNIPLNQIKIEEQKSGLYEMKKEHENEKEIDDFNESYISNKINNEMSFNKDFIMNIKDNAIIMNNFDVNSNKLFFNKKLKENMNISTDNYSSNIAKLLDNCKIKKKPKNEKAEIKINDNISIKSASSNKSKINKNQDITLLKMNKFTYLNESQSTSFSIQSIYKNINQISQYKYEKSPNLREKTEKYILEQIESDNKEKITFTKITKTNLKLLDIKSNIDKDNSKNTLSRQNSENFEKSNFSNKNKISKTRVHKRATLQFDESKISEKINPKKSLKKIERYTITPKNKNEDRPKSGRRFFSVINKKRNSIKKDKEEDMKQKEIKLFIIK